MTEDIFRECMKSIFEDLETLSIETVKTNRYLLVTEPGTKEVLIYSYATKKTYSSEQEYMKDIRKLKLERLNVLQSTV